MKKLFALFGFSLAILSLYIILLNMYVGIVLLCFSLFVFSFYRECFPYCIKENPKRRKIK